MVATKSELFEHALVEQATYYKALANPARLAILKYLAETKTCISGDISDELPLSRTTVGQHLKELKKVGLITGHVEGVKTNYCINPDQVEKVSQLLDNFLREITIPDDFSCK